MDTCSAFFLDNNFLSWCWIKSYLYPYNFQPETFFGTVTCQSKFQFSYLCEIWQERSKLFLHASKWEKENKDGISSRFIHQKYTWVWISKQPVLYEGLSQWLKSETNTNDLDDVKPCRNITSKKSINFCADWILW